MTESDSTQGYYPLEIGNLWEYWDTTWDEYLWTIITVGDTVMPNGVLYTILEADISPGNFGYIRQFGSEVYRYYTIFEQDIETLKYDFSKTTGDTVAINYYPDDTTVVTVVYDQMAVVFGQIRRQWGFWEQSQISSAYTLTEVTDSIGVTWRQWEASPYDTYLRGAMINGTTYGTLTTDRTFDVAYPDEYQLYQNYPNPFNSTTVIILQIPEEEYVTVTIFDIMGRQVRKLFRGEASVGLKKIVWDGKDDLGKQVTSGIYIYGIQSKKFLSSKKMILLR